jgi:starch phosphorylase
VAWTCGGRGTTRPTRRRLDLELWETTQNPWFVLQTVSREQIEQAWAGPVFSDSSRGVTDRLAAMREALFVDRVAA